MTSKFNFMCFLTLQEVLPKDIYPVDIEKLIDDIVHGVRGSCLTYYSRKNCSVLVKDMSLAETIDL